jgi:NitT/TauT family transport system ATP-binding protein
VPAASFNRIEAQRLGKSYGTRGRPAGALRDVSFTVDAGEFVSVIGPSGCGKSTLLGCVAGITPYDSGSLTFDGHPPPPPGVGRSVVFQDPSLLPWRTVSANIGYGMAVQRRLDAPVRRQRTAELVELMGLRGFEGYYQAQLSGGMRQRVNLARALATEPGLLLMDEPFGALDALTREQLQLELLRVRERLGCAVLFVTHDISEAALLSDRVLVMSARPGTVRTVVDVPLPRPRTAASKREPAFTSVVERLWALLHEAAA